ncbi:hypothetical protein ACEN88_35210, partial [Massilia sp. CT11-108]|uniref:hypothetical protein n=1 Tax=Massilia sp. CT11-108 TaxID=3393900 RepID=UPI0039A5F7B1
ICELVDGVQKCSPSMRATIQRLTGSDKSFRFDSHDLASNYLEADLFDLLKLCRSAQYDDDFHWQGRLSELQQ